MLEKKYITEILQRTYCYKCGASMENAKIIPITEAPLALVAHTVCPACQAEAMLTITPVGSGLMPIRSDLKGDEIKKFIGANSVSFKELLKLHASLKKESIWNLLQKKDRNQEKK
ncbi:hypothetical protein JXA34_03680 [Patescibacteria group bacterium]|nr:hypothetical protein [Patescibacteria group bacterium]